MATERSSGIEKKLVDWEKENKMKQLEKVKTSGWGFEVKPLYTPADLEGVDYLKDIGFPGEYPFTRGVYPSMYRGRLWTMRQVTGFGSPEETKDRFKKLLKEGETGLSIVFDLPTQIGYDSDDPVVEDEVARVGVAIDTLGDMEILYDGIPIEDISSSLVINATAPIILAMYIAVAKKRNLPLNKLRGTLQNDILKEFCVRGTWIFPPKPSLRLAADVVEYCTKEMPSFYPLNFCGHHGTLISGSITHALVFAGAIEYINEMLARKLDLKKVAARFSFLLTGTYGSDFFEGIAGFRAARKVWAELMKNRYKLEDPDLQRLRFHTHTDTLSLTREQPINNIIRTTILSLMAVFGGCQSLHTSSMDESYATPSEEAAEIALRTQQIIAYEYGLTSTVDPLGGSYFVEYLTKLQEEKIKEVMEDIEKQGGMLRAIETGYVQRMLLNYSYEVEKEVQSGKRVKIGLNMFKTDKKGEMKLQPFDPASGDRQISRLKEVKAKRDARKVESALRELEKAARGKENLMPYFIAASEVYATLGEMTRVLKGVFGEHKEILTV